MTTQYVYDVGALRTWMLSIPDIATLCSNRIYGNEIPASEANNMPRKVVVINSVGIGVVRRGWNAYGNTLKDIRCYGESLYEAERLHDTIKHYLIQLKRTEATPNGLLPVLLFNAVQISGKFTSREPDTEWPVCFSSYNIMVSEG